MKSGDYVVKLNGTEVADKDDLITRIETVVEKQRF